MRSRVSLLRLRSKALSLTYVLPALPALLPFLRHPSRPPLPDRKLLRKHLLTHREKQFICHYEGCNKKFCERAKLKRHFLVHTGEKPFVCPYEGCGKPFGYKANLKTHMRTHTGQRPFACTFQGCDRRFAQASNRNAHVLAHAESAESEVTCVLAVPGGASAIAGIRGEGAIISAAALPQVTASASGGEAV